ncbi:MAG: alpha-glucan phosphorylase [Nitrospirales bacterium]|nr:MAG: alpha-glucan phosphorylase [Nitrospirales bacterium]
MNMVKDPVCGMMVDQDKSLTMVYQGEALYFCSELCRNAFLENPESFVDRLGSSISDLGERSRRIAYFSMEVGVDFNMPIYSGGLGVLAGDTLKSCADLKVPTVGVSLLYAHGYFDQKLDERGNQQELPVTWDPSRFARPLPVTTQVPIEGQIVIVRAWQYDIVGSTGFTVPLILLDTNVNGNSVSDRELTTWLYGGDKRYRIAQEIVLGLGGVRMLRALGYTELERFHMNEGHAAFLVLKLLEEHGNQGSSEWDFSGIRNKCIFTTHTPVPAGHDQFSYDLVTQVLREPLPLELIQMLGGKDQLNMTYLALNMSAYVNGVAKRHGEVSQEMFPGYSIDSITNGVHSVTWTCESFKALYDRYIPGWMKDPFALRHAISIPKQEVWNAHVEAKARLIEEVNRRTQLSFNNDVLTLGFARRATPYKRADLIFFDPDELADIARTVGPIQLIFGGKAHPRDEGGKDMIRRVVRFARQLKNEVSIAYLENYDIALAKLITSGVDLWLNTPHRPLEASGTSGMKAVHNGIPNFSVLDGWWIEGHIEGVTGWSIGPTTGSPAQSETGDLEDAEELYQKLRTVIVPMFYQDRDQWIDVMRQSIAFNASFFNTHRMVQQYAVNAYV